MTHAYLGLLALDLVYAAAGYAVLHGLGLARRPSLSWLGLAFLTGWAAVGVAVTIALTLGLDASIGGFLGMAALVGVAGLALRRFHPARADTRPPQGGQLARRVAFAGAAVLALGLVAALVLAATNGADGDWDVWAFWLPKAKTIYFFHGLDVGAGGYTSYANVEYPPLVPAVTAAAFHMMGGVHAALLPLQQCLLGIAFAGGVVRLLVSRVPGWLLYPPLAMLVVTPQFWNRLPSVLPDQTLAYLLAAAVLCCLLWLVEPARALLVLAVVFLAAAALTKEEGAGLAAALAACTFVAGIARHRRAGVGAIVLALGPAAVLPWRHWLAAHHQLVSAPEYHWHDLLRPHLLTDRIHRLTYAVPRMLHFIFDTGSWTIVLPVGLLALVLAARAAPAIASATAAWLVAGFAGLAATYWIGLPEVHWYVATSAERVVATLPLVAGTAAPLLLALALEAKRR